ncbi:MAG: AAA family ATPase [Haliscomenobacter sp.]|uniref:AAA family ATPase n=1 Tax=Haliscomenobacter sp. TaxID=2717303 RepID=UPI0029A7E1BE|nr:AAA family ATPase [Haliscomenobacter sp.]MDX2072644.1 AAA family ATPase [Haliscomenobacter sp.]
MLDFDLARSGRALIQKQQALPIYDFQLPYLSPEQTGLLPASGDLRSDLYMLGCVCFEALFQRQLFSAQDARSWLYAHVSQQVILTASESASVFPALHLILNKLLEKDPHQRYQSAVGLKRDFERCLQLLGDSNTSATFLPGLEDTEPEIEWEKYPLQPFNLLQRFDDELSFSDAGLWVLESKSGMGRTRLLQNCPAPPNRGMILMGRFSFNNQRIPYHGWKEAFEQLAERLMQEDQSSLAKWTKQLLQEIPLGAKILGNWIPAFRLSIQGSDLEHVEVPLREAKNRFFSVLKTLLSIIAQERILLLVLDDVHHADSASLELLENLILEPPTLPLRFCLSVESNHQNIVLSRLLNHTNYPIKKVQLAPLGDEEILPWLGNTLGPTQWGIVDLIKVLSKRAQGVPRTLVQNLLYHQQRKDIWYNFGTCCWEWNLEAIRQQNTIPGPEVDWALAQDQTKRAGQRIALLQLNTFSENDLEFLLAGVDNPQLLLRRARAQGLVEVSLNKQLQTQKSYRIIPNAFWDKIRQSVSAEEAILIHREIIAWYSQELSFENQTRISDHFECIGSQHWDSDEAEKVFQLNCECGQKALQNYAYQVANVYFSRAISYLPAQSWELKYQQTLQLFQDAAFVKLHTGAYLEALDLIEAIFKQASIPEDKAIAVELQMETWKLRNDLNKAIDCGLAYLKDLGLPMEANPPDWKSKMLFSKVLWPFLWHRESSIILQKRADDHKAHAKAKILIALGPLVYLGRPSLLSAIMREELLLVFKHGHFDHSAYWFASLAMVLRGHLGWVKSSAKATNIAEKLLASLDYPHTRAKTLFALNFFAYHWQKSLAQTITAGKQSLDLALQTNDFEFAAYSMLLICSHSLEAGIYLNQINADLEQFIGNTASIYQIPQLNLLKIYRQYFKSLTLSGAEDAFEPIEDQPEWYRDRTAVALRYLLELESLYFFRAYSKATEVAVLRAPLQDTGAATVFFAKFIFFQALALLAEYSEKELGKKERKTVKNALRDFGKWSKKMPDTFAAKEALLCAEWQQYLGNEDRATRQYEKAIHLAAQNNCLWLHALAWERLGQWSERKRNLSLAQVQLLKARELWKEWGAENKVKQLDQNLSSIQLPSTGFYHTEDELSAVLQTASTIVGALRYEDLLDKLLRLLIEEFGAQEGLIARVIDKKVQPELQAFYKGAELICRVPEQEDRVLHYLPQSLIQRILEQKKQQVIRRTAEYESMRPKASDHLPAVLFVYPIVNRNQVIGLLFLVHHQLNNLFQERDLRRMELLAGQLGVSFQNALLYREMEQEVTKRTETIERINQEIVHKNQRLEAQIELEKKLKNQQIELNELKIQTIEQEHQMRVANAEILAQGLERKKIAEDLHDNVKSSLTAVNIQLTVLDNQNIKNEAKGSILKARRSLKEAQEELNRIMLNISPITLHDFGLEGAISTYCDNFSTQEFQIIFASNLQGARFNSKVELCFYSVCKELLANANKHANANLINVELNYDPEEFQLYLLVKDNGVGFNKDQKFRKTAMGMASIQSRVKFIEGDMVITTAPGKGASILVYAPV